ncbi:MAG: Ig-like domain-containing protein [Armatimonadetes bacterium]|nr:Ig-like domain-containing protein [Armatimonadota bacterium]
MTGKKRYAAAGALILGLFAGCGGLTTKHTEFRAGPAASVSVTPGQATMTVGAAETFRAEARDSRGLLVEGAQFTWKSLAEGVVTVANGVATGVAPGQTTIMAVYNPAPGQSSMIAQARVTVVAGEVQYSFDQHIKPIATRACSCHASMAATGSMADNGNITSRGYVVAGNPDGSSYLTVGAGGSSHSGGNAWGGDQSAVRKWIEQGAKP